ncbi:MAG: carbohydrate kinase [Kiritimatiellae bacterium]|nr:carbohydrate kinase [Kiritimatiellia bacterium]
MQTYLGIDCSTQSAKAVVIDAAGRTVARESVPFPQPYIDGPDPLVRHADPRMWLAGVEAVLGKLRDGGFDMSSIAAVGGDAQQHATVYLESLDPLVFSRDTSPIWMDSSTGAECRALDAEFGERLRLDTGSPAIERFAGPQIMKFARMEPDAFARTARIHLLSSFLTSWFAGEDAGIDVGDGAGMNLLNLKTLDWDRAVCDFISPSLLSKLPKVVRPGTSYRLAARFAEYGLRPGIPVAPFTGDNPASLVGCGAAEPGVAVLSLGTSDTFFAAMADFRTDPAGYGHVFGNPCGGFMSLVCFKNGSLARERVKDMLGVDWKFFDETAFDLTEPGNGGKRALPWFEPEITPRCDETGLKTNFDWDAASDAERVRAVVEGQMSNIAEHAAWIGKFDRIRLTGGASRSRGIREAAARAFGAEVEAFDVADSAAVGGAMLARAAAV